MKKILVFILAVALLCSIAVGTTLTYFTDEDGKVNTMTVGTVKIEQVENFEQNSNLYPYIGEIPATGDFVEANNAVKKEVTIKNTGSETAYIRTLFAFEAVNGADPVGTILHVNYNSAAGTWKKLSVNPIEITKTVNGQEITTQYYVYSFTYSATLAGGATSAVSLKQIALDSQQGNAFSEAIGGKYDILALSQAVQVQGFNDGADAAFTAAFPVSEAKLVEWFAGLNP